MKWPDHRIQGPRQRRQSPTARSAAFLVVLALALAVGCPGGRSRIERQPHPDLDAESVDAFLAAVGDGRYGDLHSTVIIMDGVTVIACTGWNDNNGRWPESMLWDYFIPAIDR